MVIFFVGALFFLTFGLAVVGSILSFGAVSDGINSYDWGPAEWIGAVVVWLSAAAAWGAALSVLRLLASVW